MRHESRADHRAVRLVDVGAQVLDAGQRRELDGRHRGVVAVGIAQRARDRVGSGDVRAVPGRQDESRAPGALDGERTAPDAGFDDVAAHADPLHVGVSGERRVAQCQDPAERRRPLLGIGDTTAVGPARRVGEDGVDAAGRQVELKRIGAQHLDIGEGHEIDCRQCRRRLVALDGEHGEAEPRQGQCVPADAAAQVGHAPGAGAGVAGGVVGRYGQARGLLQPVGREEHLGGEWPELGLGAGSQSLLGQRGRHELGRMPLVAQGLAHRQRRGFVVGRKLCEQGPALGREQGGEVRGVHRAIMARIGAMRSDESPGSGYGCDAPDRRDRGGGKERGSSWARVVEARVGSG